MEELVDKLMSLNIESESAVEVAKMWITFKYVEPILITTSVVILALVIAVIVVRCMKYIDKHNL